MNQKTVEVFRNAHKRTVAGSVENVVTKKSMRLSNDFKPFHRLSRRLHVRQRSSRVSSRLDDGLPKDKKSFPSLKKRLEVRGDRGFNIDTDDPQFNTFLKDGIRKHCKEWSCQEVLGKLDFSIKN